MSRERESSSCGGGVARHTGRDKDQARGTPRPPTQGHTSHRLKRRSEPRGSPRTCRRGRHSATARSRSRKDASASRSACSTRSCSRASSWTSWRACARSASAGGRKRANCRGQAGAERGPGMSPCLTDLTLARVLPPPPPSARCAPGPAPQPGAAGPPGAHSSPSAAAFAGSWNGGAGPASRHDKASIRFHP